MLTALPPVLEVMAQGVNLKDPRLQVVEAPKLGI